MIFKPSANTQALFHIYIYIYVCVCVCVCVLFFVWESVYIWVCCLDSFFNDILNLPGLYKPIFVEKQQW